MQVIACRQDGLVYLINLLDGKVICEVSLPENYQLATPWKPVTAVGGLGQMIYIKGRPPLHQSLRRTLPLIELFLSCDN